ncbi:MFS transporter [Microbacterium sp. gxy059]|uniref:MFS transporter n=1 Tax=Microbacterium sp. gxy059 TaxID=2957199 RepID=UPI003D9835A2
MGDEREPGGAAAEAIRRFWPMIYAPTALFSMGQGAIAPVLPTIAVDMGASIPAASLVAAALMVGQLCGNMPAGWLVSRIGERRTMLLASSALLLAIGGMSLSAHVGVLAACVLVVGVCAAAFALARHAFMTTRAPVAFRARALALVGGSFRLGTFTGPLVAAGLVWLFDDPRATFAFFAVCVVAVGLLVAFGPDPEEQAYAAERERLGSSASAAPPRRSAGLVRTIRDNRRVLARLGLAAASLASVRVGQKAILPLWGVSIGMDPAALSLLIGLAGAVEFSLFYASGQVMDRFGRLWATVPAQLTMGLGFLCLAFTHDLPQATLWFGAFAIVIGIGNGLSSGALMTLGSDAAPREDPAAFLGAWRTITDAGASSTPLIVSGVAALASLSVATGLIGGIAVAGTFAFLRWVPRRMPDA